MPPELLIMFVLLIVAMYFLMIRPQQKRAKEQAALVASLGEGDRVMLTSGIFVTIKHMGEKQAIVELSPGNEITILRQAIVRAVAEDEDEFEYEDEVVDLDEAEAAESLDAPVIDPEDPAYDEAFKPSDETPQPEKN